MSKNILNNYFSSINFSGGTGTVTISFNLVDDSNSDTPFQNVTYTGWPKSGQDIRYLTHWLSKIQNSAGGFGDFDMGLSILHKKEGLKVDAKFHTAFYHNRNSYFIKGWIIQRQIVLKSNYFCSFSEDTRQFADHNCNNIYLLLTSTKLQAKLVHIFNINFSTAGI